MEHFPQLFRLCRIAIRILELVPSPRLSQPLQKTEHEVPQSDRGLRLEDDGHLAFPPQRSLLSIVSPLEDRIVSSDGFCLSTPVSRDPTTNHESNGLYLSADREHSSFHTPTPRNPYERLLSSLLDLWSQLGTLSDTEMGRREYMTSNKHSMGRPGMTKASSDVLTEIVRQFNVPSSLSLKKMNGDGVHVGRFLAMKRNDGVSINRSNEAVLIPSAIRLDLLRLFVMILEFMECVSTGYPSEFSNSMAGMPSLTGLLSFAPRPHPTALRSSRLVQPQHRVRKVNGLVLTSMST